MIRSLVPVLCLAGTLHAAGLSREEAAASIRATFEDLVEASRAERAAELEEKSITLGEHTLKWLEKTYGEAPESGRSLWISMHGGGGTAAGVNDSQWRNQLGLYQPEEGVYVAPRAPTDTWNMWHRAHIDPLFARLIENMIALRNVDPDKVYLMGYSAGGDGVWQLAPRMADRFAAASMMAGHPNDASLLGLRNLPFGIFMGAEDAAYNRNAIAEERSADIRDLHTVDPGGYRHLSRIYEGMPHWMDGKDAEAVPWMAGFSRRNWPRKIVWLQDDVTHERFYWLRVPEGAATRGRRITAWIDGQTIHLHGDVPDGTRLLLHDRLIDLGQPVTVRINDAEPVTHDVARTKNVVRRELQKRLDPKATPTAEIVLEVPETGSEVD